MLEKDSLSILEFSSLPGQVDNDRESIKTNRSDVIITQPKSEKRRIVIKQINERAKPSILWMKKPEMVTSCYNGLEYLVNLNTLLIQQGMKNMIFEIKQS
jgi:hypothetical protein